MPSRAAVLIAHPGHEIYIFGWLAATDTPVCVLTDGSGIDRRSRLDRTRNLLGELGARPGPIFGRWTDRQVYDALLDGKVEGFVSVARELADLLVETGAERVVGDSAEGFNPTHDLCRLLLNTAARLAERRLPHAVESFDFAQFLPPLDRREAPAGSLHRKLDAKTFASKRRAATGNPDIAEEVSDAFERIGEGAFRSECLRPAGFDPGAYRPREDPPVYERFGEALQRAGRVSRVIRYREHMLPIAEALSTEIRRVV